MIRTKEPQVQLFYSAEELHRPSRTNFYARLNAAVGSWRELCEPLTVSFSPVKTGRPVDHVVYFKIFLVGYLEGIIWDTDLAERVADSLSVREFVGYGPSERTPDHSSLSRARLAFGQKGRLEKVLENTVVRCVQAGLVSGEEVAVDSTLIPANASLSSLKCVRTGTSVREHLRKAKEAGEKLSVGNETFVSTSDPDAQIAKKGTSAPRGMYYKTSIVVDSKAQVILSEGAGAASLGDADSALGPLKAAKATLEAQGLSLGKVVADSAYDDSKFHAFVEEELAATPITNYRPGASPKEGRLGCSSFAYDPLKDLYLCPMGKELPNKGRSGERTIYSSKASDCRDCPLAQACLGQEMTRRTLHRTPHQSARERNNERCHTDEGRSSLKRRKTVAEPPFAHMKYTGGGLSRINCRGLAKAGVKTGVGSIAWNLLKLVKTVPADLFLRSWALFGPKLRNYLARQWPVRCSIETR